MHNPGPHQSSATKAQPARNGSAHISNCFAEYIWGKKKITLSRWDCSRRLWLMEPPRHPLQSSRNSTTKQVGIFYYYYYQYDFGWRERWHFMVTNQEQAACCWETWIRAPVFSSHLSGIPRVPLFWAPLLTAAQIYSSLLSLLITTALLSQNNRFLSLCRARNRTYSALLLCCCLPLQIILDYHCRATESLSCNNISASLPFSAWFCLIKQYAQTRSKLTAK